MVNDFGAGFAHILQILQVSTISFTSLRACWGAPATLRISISLALAACQNRMWRRLSVRRTTVSLVECSSFRALRRSYDVHSAVPASAWVPASTPLGLGPLAGAEAPLVGPEPYGSGGGGTTAASLLPSATYSSASPACASASTAALRVGGCAPRGALGAGTGCDHAGGRLATGGPIGTGSSITSSTASGAGAPGRMPADGSLCAGGTAPRIPESHSKVWQALKRRSILGCAALELDTRQARRCVCPRSGLHAHGILGSSTRRQRRMGICIGQGCESASSLCVPDCACRQHM